MNASPSTSSSWAARPTGTPGRGVGPLPPFAAALPAVAMLVLCAFAAGPPAIAQTQPDPAATPAPTTATVPATAAAPTTDSAPTDSAPTDEESAADASPATDPAPEPVDGAAAAPDPEAAGEPVGAPVADPAPVPTAPAPDLTVPVAPGEEEVTWSEGEECELDGKPKDGVERGQRLLLETLCEATLWADGLFGGDPDVANARNVSGRLEISGTTSQYWGDEYDLRLRLNYDLPTLERRLKLFLGRDHRDDFVADRRDGIVVRSSVFAAADDNRWLAGLGWSPPGRFREKVDFRVGGDLSESPEVFVQGRYRQNVFVGENAVWRLRETVFYENDDGFGSTTGIDFDRVLTPDMMLRMSANGTWTERTTEGLDWRSSAVLYRNLLRNRAAAAELFVNGETDALVPLREYGARVVYRHPIRRQSLFAELIGGYSWPKEVPGMPRDGSAMVGIGLELLFGRDPF